jgi:hypothetical protein
MSQERNLRPRRYFVTGDAQAPARFFPVGIRHRRQSTMAAASGFAPLTSASSKIRSSVSAIPRTPRSSGGLGSTRTQSEAASLLSPFWGRVMGERSEVSGRCCGCDWRQSARSRRPPADALPRRAARGPSSAPRLKCLALCTRCGWVVRAPTGSRQSRRVRQPTARSRRRSHRYRLRPRRAERRGGDVAVPVRSLTAPRRPAARLSCAITNASAATVATVATTARRSRSSTAAVSVSSATTVGSAAGPT